MKNQFVPYEMALKLKELGFDVECLASYYHAGKNLDINQYIHNGKYTVLAPLWQQVIDWLRINHNIHIKVDYYPVKNPSGPHKFISSISILDPNFANSLGLQYGIPYNIISEELGCEIFENYEAAREQAIRSALELIN